MLFLLQYLIKFSVSLAVLYTFYYVVLRPLTFYQWNRFYLICYSLLSFIIPFINITEWLAVKNIRNSYLVNSIPAVVKLTSISFNTTGERNILSGVLGWNVAGSLFLSGALIMLVRIVYQYLSLNALKRRAVLLKTGDFEFYDVNGPITPFSFANAIFINSRLHSEEEFHKILEHEFVHVKQKHTIDIALAELVCVVNWFNPFAWLIRKSIRQNLEFIADKNVLDGGVDPRRYQYLLLKVMGLPQFTITNNFSFSSLKKRITMMNKMKTAKVHLIKFMFVLPLLTVMLLAFRDAQKKQATNAQIIDFLKYSKAGSDTIPPPAPVPPVAPTAVIKNKLPVAPLPPVLPVHVKPVKALAPLPPMPPVKAVPVKLPITVVLPVTSVQKVTVVKNVSYIKQGKTFSQKQAVSVSVPVTLNVPVTIETAIDTIPAKPVTGIIKPLGSLQPLYIVDGVMLPLGKDIQDMDPSSIGEINVLKDGSAIALYGEKAKGGVVLVKSKKKMADDAVTVTSSKIVISNIKEIKGLIIVDGQETTKEKLDAINPELIRSISVLKDKSATALYGEKGINGVIIVTTTKGL